MSTTKIIISLLLKSFRKPIKKLWPKKGIKKPVMWGLKSSSKLIVACILIGGGVELASHMVSKAQGVDNVSEYVLMEDFQPSFVRFDYVDLGHRARDQRHTHPHAVQNQAPVNLRTWSQSSNSWRRSNTISVRTMGRVIIPSQATS